MFRYSCCIRRTIDVDTMAVDMTVFIIFKCGFVSIPPPFLLSIYMIYLMAYLAMRHVVIFVCFVVAIVVVYLCV